MCFRMEDFRADSLKRKKEKRYENRTYDPESRAKWHKKNYDPVKRAKKYQEDKLKKQEEMKNKAEEMDKYGLLDYKKSNAEKAKNLNLSNMKSAEELLEACVSRFNSLPLSNKARAQIKQIEENIEEKFNAFEKEISQATEDTNQETVRWEAVGKIFGKLICTRKESPARIYKEWHDLEMNVDISFKGIAEELGIFHSWVKKCYCDRCKKAKKINDKEAAKLKKKDLAELEENM